MNISNINKTTQVYSYEIQAFLSKFNCFSGKENLTPSINGYILEYIGMIHPTIQL